MTVNTDAGHAIRAIEDCQMAAYKRWDAAELINFTKLMAKFREEIFKGIALAANQGHREFRPLTIPGFAIGCDGVFHQGLFYKADMLNFWLYAHDFKHLMHAEPGGVIRW